ncbi:hypothetical protein B0H63DRAFT_563530 [Podospora didyma]|uniref:Uncharacterized protein n=1 Tax=Podospora didyma TaxID=330526 RepID=A0AAE0N6G4_9PEZI|nr:hypothetical protein B0H63DRAFT_563530 [Podospora didyma]
MHFPDSTANTPAGNARLPGHVDDRAQGSMSYQPAMAPTPHPSTANDAYYDNGAPSFPMAVPRSSSSPTEFVNDGGSVSFQDQCGNIIFIPREHSFSNGAPSYPAAGNGVHPSGQQFNNIAPSMPVPSYGAQFQVTFNGGVVNGVHPSGAFNNGGQTQMPNGTPFAGQFLNTDQFNVVELALMEPPTLKFNKLRCRWLAMKVHLLFNPPIMELTLLEPPIAKFNEPRCQWLEVALRSLANPLTATFTPLKLEPPTPESQPPYRLPSGNEAPNWPATNSQGLPTQQVANMGYQPEHAVYNDHSSSPGLHGVQFQPSQKGIGSDNGGSPSSPSFLQPPPPRQNTQYGGSVTPPAQRRLSTVLEEEKDYLPSPRTFPPPTPTKGVYVRDGRRREFLADGNTMSPGQNMTELPSVPQIPGRSGGLHGRSAPGPVRSSLGGHSRRFEPHVNSRRSRARTNISNPSHSSPELQNAQTPQENNPRPGQSAQRATHAQAGGPAASITTPTNTNIQVGSNSVAGGIQVPYSTGSENRANINSSLPVTAVPNQPAPANTETELANTVNEAPAGILDTNIYSFDLHTSLPGAPLTSVTAPDQTQPANVHNNPGHTVAGLQLWSRTNSNHGSRESEAEDISSIYRLTENPPDASHAPRNTGNSLLPVGLPSRVLGYETPVRHEHASHSDGVNPFSPHAFAFDGFDERQAVFGLDWDETEAEVGNGGPENALGDFDDLFIVGSRPVQARTGREGNMVGDNTRSAPRGSTHDEGMDRRWHGPTRETLGSYLTPNNPQGSTINNLSAEERGLCNEALPRNIREEGPDCSRPPPRPEEWIPPYLIGRFADPIILSATSGRPMRKRIPHGLPHRIAYGGGAVDWVQSGFQHGNQGGEQRQTLLSPSHFTEAGLCGKQRTPGTTAYHDSQGDSWRLHPAAPAAGAEAGASSAPALAPAPTHGASTGNGGGVSVPKPQGSKKKKKKKKRPAGEEDADDDGQD